MLDAFIEMIMPRMRFARSAVTMRAFVAAYRDMTRERVLD